MIDYLKLLIRNPDTNEQFMFTNDAYLQFFNFCTAVYSK